MKSFLSSYWLILITFFCLMAGLVILFSAEVGAFERYYPDLMLLVLIADLFLLFGLVVRRMFQFEHIQKEHTSLLKFTQELVGSVRDMGKGIHECFKTRELPTEAQQPSHALPPPIGWEFQLEKAITVAHRKPDNWRYVMSGMRHLVCGNVIRLSEKIERLERELGDREKLINQLKQERDTSRAFRQHLEDGYRELFGGLADLATQFKSVRTGQRTDADDEILDNVWARRTRIDLAKSLIMTLLDWERFNYMLEGERGSSPVLNFEYFTEELEPQVVVEALDQLLEEGDLLKDEFGNLPTRLLRWAKVKSSNDQPEAVTAT